MNWLNIFMKPCMSLLAIATTRVSTSHDGFCSCILHCLCMMYCSSDSVAQSKCSGCVEDASSEREKICPSFPRLPRPDRARAPLLQNKRLRSLLSLTPLSLLCDNKMLSPTYSHVATQPSPSHPSWLLNRFNDRVHPTPPHHVPHALPRAGQYSILDPRHVQKIRLL